MKQIFFYFCGGLLAILLAGWALYMVWEALVQVFNDWRLGRELNELEMTSSARREQRRAANEKRLATNCEHDFRSGAVGLPPAVCAKCGLEQEKPTGGCDHVWRVKPGPVPSSACEKCGKSYSPLESSSAIAPRHP
jgi:ribosomal protein L32